MDFFSLKACSFESECIKNMKIKLASNRVTGWNFYLDKSDLKSFLRDITRFQSIFYPLWENVTRILQRSE